MDIAEMRGLVRRDLKDEDSDNYRWTDDEIDRAIGRAVAELSRYAARPMKNTIATTDDSREIDISALTDRLSVDQVEFPIDEHPRIFQRFTVYQDTLTLIGAYQGDGEDCYIYWSKIHTLGAEAAWAATEDYSLLDLIEPTTHNGYYYRCTTAGTSGTIEPTWPTSIGGTVADNTVIWTCEAIPPSTSTIPTYLEDLVALGAAGFAASGASQYHTDRANVGGDNVDRDYLYWATGRLMEFRKQLKQLRKNRKLRTSTFYTGDYE